MKRAFIIGHPISHSLSPKMHKFWLDELGIEGSYEAIDVAPENLEAELKRLQNAGYVGGNVTIPHKEAVMKFCDEIVGLAKGKTKAINTLVFIENKIVGYNSDVYGFSKNLSSNGIDFDNINSCLVIGAGGAAIAILTELRMFFPPSNIGQSNRIIYVTNRTRDKSAYLSKEFECCVIDWDKKETILPSVDLVINTTSLGMKGQPELDINLNDLRKNSIVTDIVYNPLETNLLKQSHSLGIKTVDGLGMLIYQGVLGFTKWFGVDPSTKEGLLEKTRELLVKNLS